MTRLAQWGSSAVMATLRNRSWLSVCRVWLASVMSLAVLIVALAPVHGCPWDTRQESASATSTQPADDGAPVTPDAILVHVCTQCSCGQVTLPTIVVGEMSVRLAPLSFYAAHEPPALPAGLVRSDEPPRT